MGHAVVEDVEDRIEDRVVRRKIIKTDDPQYPSGYRYSHHYGYVDGRGTILRYDNENRTIGRHSGNSAEAHPFRGGRKRVSYTTQTTEHSSADSPTPLKNINKE